MSGDLEFGKFDINPENAGELAKKYELITKKYDALIKEIETLTDDQALEVTKYLQSLIKTGMEPSMMAELLDHRMQQYRK
jgi:hypothetical protein